MIKGLDKIRADGWQLNLTSGQQTAVDNLLLESDGHNVFARGALIRTPGAELTVEDCYAAYVEFCSQRGWSAMPKNKFSRDIGDVVARIYGLTVRHDIKGANGKDQRGWKDLQVRDQNAQPTGQTASKCSNRQFPDASDAFSSVEWGKFCKHTATANISWGASEKDPSETSGRARNMQPLLH
jgi:hypothetical protein